MKKVGWFMCAVLVLAAGLALADARPSDAHTRRKYIWFSWDTQNCSAEEVLANAALFDETPYDGIPVVSVVDDPATGKKVRIDNPLEAPEITDGMMKSQVEVYRGITAHRSLRETFVSVLYTPKKRAAWTDDATWARAARSMGAVARAAKAGGLRGVFMDVEEYNPPKQFERATNDPPFEVTAKLARRRGAEVFGALWRNFPEASVLSCFGLLAADANFDYFGSPDPFDATRQKNDLWPHFFNGMLDAMPAGVKLIDGTEMAYEFKQSREEYVKAALCVKTRALGLVFPENRAKYAAAISASFGFFMDAYVRPNEQDRYWFGPLNGSRLGTFDDNLAGATFWCDEYVWLYAASQRMTGIKWKNIKGAYGSWTTVEERLPGYTDVLLANKDPVAFFLKRHREMSAAGTLTNLCARPIAEIVKPDKEDPNRLFGVVEFPGAKSGEWFGFRFKAKGEVQSIVRWGEKGLKRRPMGASICPSATPMGDPDADGWRVAIGVVRIPNDRQSPIVVLKVNRTEDKGSDIRDFALYRLMSHWDDRK